MRAACRAQAAALEVTRAGVQDAVSERTFASALVAAAAAADGVAAPSGATGRAGGGSLRRPGAGEVSKADHALLTHECLATAPHWLCRLSLHKRCATSR